MDVITDKKHTIFRKDFENKKTYSIGLSKKDKDGNYVNGYLSVVFNKDVELDNKTQIMIKKAWLDFFLKDKKTYPYIRISDFEIVGYIQEQPKEEPENDNFKEDNFKEDKWESGKNIEIDPDDLPFY